MFASTPESSAEEALYTWKTLGPITLEKAEALSPEYATLFPPIEEVEFRDCFMKETHKWQGSFKVDTNERHGLVRRIFDNGTIYEE